MFKGSITALITPFKAGKLDEACFQSLVNRQVEGGSHGIVPCGTTGEAPCLTPDEHKRVIDIAIEGASGRIPVIAGVGTNNTEATIARARHAEQAGADGLLIVTPYYNKPTQEGLYQHFKAIAGACGLPILIYNIPGRTAVDMSIETMARLYEACPTIVGLKDATGDLSRVKKQTQLLGDDFIQLSGDDINALEFAELGGRGCVSVSANLAPTQLAKFQDYCLAGDFKAAGKIHHTFIPVHRDLFVETNPAPVKYAASLMGLCQPDVRLPLVPISTQSRKVVQSALSNCGLLTEG